MQHFEGQDNRRRWHGQCRFAPALAQYPPSVGKVIPVYENNLLGTPTGV
jgi:hypothetical protein